VVLKIFTAIYKLQMNKEEYRILVKAFISGEVFRYYNNEKAAELAQKLRSETIADMGILANDFARMLGNFNEIYKTLKVERRTTVFQGAERQAFFIGFEEGRLKKKETLVCMIEESAIGEIKITLPLKSPEYTEILEIVKNKIKPGISY